MNVSIVRQTRRVRWPWATFVRVTENMTPGWYDDPWIPGHRRWWDGHTWTYRSETSQNIQV